LIKLFLKSTKTLSPHCTKRRLVRLVTEKNIVFVARLIVVLDKEDKKASVTSNTNSNVPGVGAGKSSTPNKNQTASISVANKSTNQTAPKKGGNTSAKLGQLVLPSSPLSNNTTSLNILPKPVLSPVKIIQSGTGNVTTLQAQPLGVVLPPNTRSPLKNATSLSSTPVGSLLASNSTASTPLTSHNVVGPSLVTLLPLPQIGTVISPLQSTGNTPGQSPISPRTGSVVTTEPLLQAAFQLLQQVSPGSKQRIVNTGSPLGHVSPPLLSPTISPVAYLNASARVLPPKPSEGYAANNNVNMNNSNMLSPGSAVNKRKADPLPDESPPKKHKS